MKNIIHFQPTNLNKKELIEKISKLKIDINNFYESVPEEIEINDKLKLGYFNSFCELFLTGNYPIQFMDLYVTKMEQFEKPKYDETLEILDYYDLLVTYTMLVLKLENEILLEPIEKTEYIVTTLNQSEISPTQFYIPAQLLLNDDIYNRVLPKRKLDPNSKAISLIEKTTKINEYNRYSSAVNYLNEYEKEESPLSSIKEIYDSVMISASLLKLNMIMDYAHLILQLDSFPNPTRYYALVDKIRNNHGSNLENQLYQIMQLTQFLLLNKQLWLLPEEELEVRCFGKKIEQSEDSKSK